MPTGGPGSADLVATSRQRNYQLRHKRTGLCHDCSRPVVTAGLFCEVHRLKRNLENRKWRRKIKRKTRLPKSRKLQVPEELENVSVEEFAANLRSLSVLSARSVVEKKSKLSVLYLARFPAVPLWKVGNEFSMTRDHGRPKQ
jgi:hypothetical protein